MIRSSRSPLALLGALFLLLTVVACQPQTPEERIAEARASYTVELNSWFPREPEPVAPEIVEGELEEAGEAIEDAAEAVEGAAEEMVAEVSGEPAEVEVVDVDNVGPREVTVFFDLIVLFEGDDPLPGLTLEISQAGADGAEKNAWRRYVELPSHIKGSTEQVSFEIEDVEFSEGDQFSVALRQGVPAAERGEYREFASAD